MTARFPRPRFSQPWSSKVVAWSDSGVRVVLRRDREPGATVELVRCVTGRLRLAYPVAARDIEVRVLDVATSEDLTAVLRAAGPAAREADPQCRKVVFAVDRSEPGCGPLSYLDAIEAAEAAGFRYVVDVDLADAELSLLVAEPEWATAVDIDLDHVPGT
ncbi:hypothetical protein [Rhodococcus sp. O3]|uniref:hypothetical protein n=1 Tax=Rhodococcus sp. O3 TaxID=3404919 RepID=UPI003B66F8B8